MNKIKILVVEDENIVAMDVKHRLKNLGYAVAARTASGEEAIKKATETRPDLVLMDIRLKGKMDGIEAAEHIRERFDIPVIYLTAHADETTLHRAKITEPYGYLLKPFEEKELHSTISMAIYRHRMERDLKESRQWLSTTLNSIGDAVIATDTQGCIKFMNPVAEALTGWPQAAALGKDSWEIFNIINGKTRQPCESPVANVLRNGTVVGLEENTVLIAKDGTELQIDDSAAPIRDDKGHTSGVVLVFRDITERKQAEDKLRQYAIELQMQNEELDAFAHTVAHDLKGPLSPMVGFAEMVDQYFSSMPDELREGLQMIARGGRKLANVIDELLLLAQVRKTGVKVKSLNMETIAAEAQRRLYYMIDEYRPEIIVPTDWPVAYGYAPWIEEVWVNYLSNALKYGGRPPRIELGGAVQADGQARFWVHDNGPGLEPEEQTRLFAPFTQLSEIRTAGHGLGLSIVRRIMEKLSGQAGVESEGVPGHGCIFYFTLPAQPSRPAENQDTNLDAYFTSSSE